MGDGRVDVLAQVEPIEDHHRHARGLPAQHVREAHAAVHASLRVQAVESVGELAEDGVCVELGEGAALEVVLERGRRRGENQVDH